MAVICQATFAPVIWLAKYLQFEAWREAGSPFHHDFPPPITELYIMRAEWVSSHNFPDWKVKDKCKTCDTNGTETTFIVILSGDLYNSRNCA